MQSRNEGSRELEAQIPWKRQPRSFDLYEEYSHRHISETIQACKDGYEKAGLQARGKLETEVEIEVGNFCIWLESDKKLAPFAAYYYSVSLKSLLLGLPTGLHLAQLFDIALERLEI
jgi:hypothetical protein